MNNEVGLRHICHECGGTVMRRSAEGLIWESIPGVPMGIPAAILLSRCDSCDDYGVTADDVDQIELALRSQVETWLSVEVERTIEFLRIRDRITPAQLEAVAGVGYGYFSRGMVPSLTLLRLLQAFVACPSEIQRHLARRPTLER